MQGATLWAWRVSVVRKGRAILSLSARVHGADLRQRNHVSRRNVERAAEAPPTHENVHIHQQDSPHGLLQILPGFTWHLLRRHQDQTEEGGFPLHRRHLVLGGDGNRAGMWLLQMPVVTAQQFVLQHSPPPFCESYTSTRLSLGKSSTLMSTSMT